MGSKYKRTNDGENVLLKAPAMGTQSTEFQPLSDGDPGQANLLVVSYHRTPDNWVRSWRNQGGELPAEFGFIYVGDSMRSATTAQPSTPTAQGPPAVTGVANPSDLTELGIRISEYLEDWRGNGHRTWIYFDSITSLLQYVEDVQRAFKFLHVLVGRVGTVEAEAYYKLTPDAHSDKTVATLLGLFDRVAEWSDTGQPE